MFCVADFIISCLGDTFCVQGVTLNASDVILNRSGVILNASGVTRNGAASRERTDFDARETHFVERGVSRIPCSNQEKSARTAPAHLQLSFVDEASQQLLLKIGRNS